MERLSKYIIVVRSSISGSHISPLSTFFRDYSAAREYFTKEDVDFLKYMDSINIIKLSGRLRIIHPIKNSQALKLANSLIDGSISKSLTTVNEARLPGSTNVSELISDLRRTFFDISYYE